jgi:hypothetical protein
VPDHGDPLLGGLHVHPEVLTEQFDHGRTTVAEHGQLVTGLA